MAQYIFTTWYRQCIIVCILLLLVFPLGALRAEDTVLLTQAETDQLQQELQNIEKQIVEYELQLSGVSSEKATVANKIKQLKTEQNKLKLQIKETTLNIKSTESQMVQTQKKINVNNQKLTALQDAMATMLQEIHEQNYGSLMKVMLAEDYFSEFYTQLTNYAQMTQSLTALTDQIQNETKQLDDHKQELGDQKEQLQNFASIKTLQNQQLSQTITTHNTLLAEKTVAEKNVKTVLNDAKQRAATIRSRIYNLLGITREITFGEAVQMAQDASQKTGVRAEFLLAVLTQESNLGKNVGMCNRPGDPPEKGWREVMKPERDQEPFLQITQELGLDPDITPVSCPMRDSRGNRIGWGGAMGPAQFIPSTWVGYKNKVTALTGKPANPWDIRDAFLAAAIKLKAGGAGTKSGEWVAAMRYFSGSTNTKYRFYGDNVLAIAKQYETDIKELNG